MNSCQHEQKLETCAWKKSSAFVKFGIIFLFSEVIEAYPGTAIIFCGSLLTLVFGVLNMIAPWHTCQHQLLMEKRGIKKKLLVVVR